MNELQTLSEALLELLQEIEGTEITLIIGGGFGLYLKIEQTRKHTIRTPNKSRVLARGAFD